MTSHTAPLHPVVAKMRRIESELNRYLIGRSEEIHGSLLALAARQHVFLLGAPGTAKCVTGDTLILDPSTGVLRRADTIVEAWMAGERDAKVASLGDGDKIVEAPITAAASNGMKPVFTVKTRLGRSIRATANHPLLTIDGWRRVDELSAGDMIASPRVIPFFGNEDRPVAEVGLVAFLIGDGGLTSNTPVLTAHPSSAVWPRAQSYADALGLLMTDKGRMCFSIADPESSWKRANRLTERLEALGLWGKTSAEKRVPEEYFRLPAGKMAIFLNHLFATDGGVEHDKNHRVVSYSTISEGLAKDVQHLLLRFGVVSKIRSWVPTVYAGNTKRAYRVVISDRQSLDTFAARIGILGKEERLSALMADNESRPVNTNLDLLPLSAWALVEQAMAGYSWAHLATLLGTRVYRYRRDTQRITRHFVAAVASLTGNHRLTALASGDVWWDEIVSIDYDGEEMTYDLEVASTCNFVANDLVVHNSLLAAEVARRVRGAEFYRIDLHAYTMREELFGPISLTALRERDALERKTAGFLPAAHIAQLDEIWKCPPATLNTLLAILNEREFRNDDELLRAPLVSAFVTSNETPPADRTLDALYDRILLRYQVAPLRDTADRRRATELSLSLRAFEAEARRAAADLTEARGHSVAAARERRAIASQSLSGEQLAAEAPDPAIIAAAGLNLARPERWLIDRYGELFSDPEERERFRSGHFTGADLPTTADRAELLRRMVAWADDQDLWLPYETFLSLSDVEALNGLVLSMTMPESVEDAFYRIIDVLGGISVRRETELRTLVAAEAVAAGHPTISADDLGVMVHALWDRPDMIAEARRAVEKESGNLAKEIDALRATIDTWRGEASEARSVSDSLNFRTQMDQELARFKRLAEAYPDNAELAASFAEAQRFRDEFNAKLFMAAPGDDDKSRGAIPLPPGQAGPRR